MVRILCSIFSLFIVIFFASAAQALTLQDSSGKSIFLTEYKGLIVSKFCVENQKVKCEALKVANKKYKKAVAEENSKKISMANPASVYCELLHGTPITLLDPKGNAHSYCQFKDSSLIDAWSLYRKHFDSDSK